MGTAIQVRRVYDEPAKADGVRVLVDRMWPRGLRKDAARLDEWAKDVAPSAELRTWYQHDPAKFGEFRQRYVAELAAPGAREALARLREMAAGLAGNAAHRHEERGAEPGGGPRRVAAGARLTRRRRARGYPRHPPLSPQW